MTQPRGFATHEEALAALIAHMKEPLPHGHGMDDKAFTDEPIRHHSYKHKFEPCTHEHKRAEDDE